VALGGDLCCFCRYVGSGSCVVIYNGTHCIFLCNRYHHSCIEHNSIVKNLMLATLVEVCLKNRSPFSNSMQVFYLVM
jgi:hypothetical protein